MSREIKPIDIKTDNLDSAISEICVSCGMCCDGTLFSQAKLKNDTDRKLADAMGFSTVNEDDKQLFKLPCHHFKGCCTVYDQQRPATCGRFFCEPIKKAQQGKLTISEVRAIINKAMQFKRHFEQQLSKFPELNSKSIFEVQQMMYGVQRNATEQKKHQHQYAYLYVVGIKLFPLLQAIKSTHKTTTSPNKPDNHADNKIPDSTNTENNEM